MQKNPKQNEVVAIWNFAVRRDALKDFLTSTEAELIDHSLFQVVPIVETGKQQSLSSNVKNSKDFMELVNKEKLEYYLIPRSKESN